MAKSKRDALSKARQYSDFLLFQATGGIIGMKPKPGFKEPEGITFGEKRGLLDSLLKIATMESQIEEPEESPFEAMRRAINGSETAGDKRDNWGDVPGESGKHDSKGNTESASTEPLPGEDLT